MICENNALCKPQLKYIYVMHSLVTAKLTCLNNMYILKYNKTYIIFSSVFSILKPEYISFSFLKLRTETVAKLSQSFKFNLRLS
jgi:hypothetical protein